MNQIESKTIYQQLLLTFIISIFCSSCIGVSHIIATTGASESLVNEIPKGAKVVFVEKENITEADLFNEVYTILLSRGHRIQKDDPNRYYIMTEGKDVGQSTLQRMTLVVTKTEKGAKLKINTEWKPGTGTNIMVAGATSIPVYLDWAEAKWEINRLGIAFSERLVLARQLKASHL